MQLLISFCLFNYGVNVAVKFDLSIENYNYLKIIEGKQILYGELNKNLF